MHLYLLYLIKLMIQQFEYWLLAFNLVSTVLIAICLLRSIALCDFDTTSKPPATNIGPIVAVKIVRAIADLRTQPGNAVKPSVNF